MKYFRLSALTLAVALFAASCETKKDDQADKIAALEQKLAKLEASQPVPANVSTVATADPSSLGQFGFSEMEYDFGTISEGKVVEHLFKFTNEGQAPLVISNITASCGCTSPDWTKTPIKPGEEGFVKVVFNSTAKTGTQAPTVTIQANTNPNVTRLRLKGNVTPKMASASPNQLGPVKK
jgi:LEA14-like dessication related protein